MANAATVLTNMATQEALRMNIQSRDIMHALIGPLHSANIVVQSKAALTIAAIACDVEARAEVSVFITSALIFLVITYGWIDVKHFQMFELIHHLSFSKLMQRFGKQMGII